MSDLKKLLKEAYQKKVKKTIDFSKKSLDFSKLIEMVEKIYDGIEPEVMEDVVESFYCWGLNRNESKKINK